MGLEVLPPDVNESFTRFSVVKGTKNLRFGLLAVKGLGEDVVDSIILERKQNGPYKDLTDFAARITNKSFNRKSLESLIKSGAMDGFADRNGLFFNIDTILEYHRRLTQEASSGQFNLFASSQTGLGRPPLHLRPAPPALQQEMLQWEKELLGLYVSAHPFKEYAKQLKGLFIDIQDLASKKKEKSVRVGGMLSNIKRILTKNNEHMAFGKLADMTGEIEVVIFPRVFRDKPELWEGDRAMVISGRVQEKDGDLKFIAETGYEVTPQNVDEIAKYISQTVSHGPEEGDVEAKQKREQAVTLYLRAHLPESILHKLRAIFDQHPGQYLVYFAVDNAGGRQKILSSYRIAFDELIEKELEAILGPDTVKVEV